MVARVQHGHSGAVRAGEALAALADAGAAITSAASFGDALKTLADAVVTAVAADAAVVYADDPVEGCCVAVGVASASPALGAQLEGTRFPSADLGRDDLEDVIARRLRVDSVLHVPIVVADRRVGAGFVVGDALAAGADQEQTAEHVTRLSTSATGAVASLLWRRRDDRALELVASTGLDRDSGDQLSEAAAAVEEALAMPGPISVAPSEGELPGGAGVSATLQLGHPPVGALQLLYAAGAEPSADAVSHLITFGVRAAQSLRASSRARTVAGELERTRALLAVVGQAFSQLSLVHTLETVVARVAELFGIERLAVYLRDEGRLYAAAGTGLTGPHVRLAERLLELALGPYRGRGMVAIKDVARDPRLAVAGDAAAESGIESAVAVPLLVGDESIGLLAVLPERSRTLTENESTLLRALAAQIAVAVQNAQLHEETKRLGEERERALDSERAAARQLRGLYEISRSFAQSLSLDATLEAVARTVTDVLDVDLAAIFMPDDRREQLVPRALHIGDARLAEVARTIVWRKQAFGTRPVQRLFRLGEPFKLGAAAVRRMGAPATALEPFLERGWSGAVVPVATPAEMLAALLLISTRSANRVSDETIDSAQAIGGQAALAIDNARLYQQQKEFADTMQRSLLPRSLPQLPGLELGEAYQSSARVEVGGDIYDFVELEEGRLAVVLGDVTGHGIEAAADMAMAKFVFRSLAREHPC